MTTPAIAIRMPTNLRVLICSSARKKCAMTTVNIGVVAFKMEASPDAMLCCPQTIRKNGMALFNIPMPRKVSQTSLPWGRAIPRARMIAHNTDAASPTRHSTITSGGSSDTAISTKKNDPPHRMDKANSISHSRTPIVA